MSWFSKLDDKLNLSKIGKEIVSANSQFLSGGSYDATGRDGYALKALGLVTDPVVLPDAPTPPGADQARLVAEQNRRKRGRAQSILSERPASPLGYTGGGYTSAAQLLGAS